MVRAAVVALLLVVSGASMARAQNVETDPLQCWWRTSAGAVRVGEPFTTVLTCAVLETDDVKVVVDESRLEPSVVQFAPFETLGGSHAVDLRNGDRRFFQYEYRLRVIAENLFGKDVALPETKIGYRVQSKVGQKTAVEGRDQSYILPPMSVRLVSLVPADAADIRDASSDTFGAIDQRAFRANILVVVGGVLFALAALVAMLALVRAIVRARKPAAAADRLLSDSAILRGVGRQLKAVQRQREDGGWTAPLAAQALSALRILGAYALGKKAARAIVGRQSAEASAFANGGSIVVRTGWPKTKNVAISGAVTRQSIANAIRRTNNGGRPGELEALEEALSRFTAAQYGRDGTLSDAALDESLAASQDLLGRLKFEQLPIVRRFRGRTAATEGMHSAWSR